MDLKRIVAFWMRNCICNGFSSPTKSSQQIYGYILWLQYRFFGKESLNNQHIKDVPNQEAFHSAWIALENRFGFFSLFLLRNRYTESTHLCLHTRKREIAFTSSFFSWMKKKSDRNQVNALKHI